jgi:soluble lytic murein transglycosylase
MQVRRCLPVLLCLTLAASTSVRTQRAANRPDASLPALEPTRHPAVPADPDELWLVPNGGEVRAADSALVDRFRRGVALLADDKAREARPLVSAKALASTPLADYATYFTALADLQLARPEEARGRLAPLVEERPPGHLGQAVVKAAAAAAAAAGDHAAAVALLESVPAEKTAEPDEWLAALGRAALAAGDRPKAAAAFHRLYYEFPLSPLAEAGGAELQRLRVGSPPPAGIVQLDLGRALQLFGARQYREARAAFDALRSDVEGDDAEVVQLRIAECDYYLGRHQSAADRLRPYLERASRKAEAHFFYLGAVRGLGRTEEYLQRTRALAETFPDSSWTEEALNNLASHYIRENDDAQADRVFREMYERFPTGARAERAAWKIGWWAFKNGRFADAARVFERAAATLARVDLRPAFIYWAARAHDRIGNADAARDRYVLAVIDYRNSYYGHRAADILRERRLPVPGDESPTAPPSTTLAPRSRESSGPGKGPFTTTASPENGASPGPEPRAVAVPTEPVIRSLLAAGLFDAALDELRFAERTWGDSPRLQATVAWVLYKTGDLRTAITLMKRAYPQYLTAGVRLPAPLLAVMYPLDYWDLIRRHAASRKLDPYLVAAIINQESAFAPAVRSAANAYGLMQIVPSTGRRIARSIGVRRFSTSMLTTPETNIRIGTTYFARLLDRFDEPHLALAGYNAGEHRVVRWTAERPGLEVDEFVDDIPFPETQNYVKKVLGGTREYRRLYAELGAKPAAGRPSSKTR